MKYTIFILTLVLSACSPKLTTNYVNQSYPLVSSFESFGIVENDSIGFDETDFIGQIELKDNSLSINCDYWTIIEQMKTEARKAGGNLLRIDEHKKPSTHGSRCHQIKASVFRVDNPRAYEKKINWHSSRKLEIEDFKGAIENRAFQAFTHSEIEYYIRPKSFKDEFHIKLHTQFNCFKSYFKKSESDSSVLAHEQLHFDITEIYARRLYKALLEANLDPYQLRNQVNNLLNDIETKLSKTQDKYDSEVYENPELQTKWNSWVTTELEKLKDYEQKEIKNYDGKNRNQIR